ncbi:MAG TPA: hypothetical protein VD973_09015 [Symbiobacteriaceae bacterium]|nr:hypothetical protein [Symbiobacteriaceae bacterium]
MSARERTLAWGLVLMLIVLGTVAVWQLRVSADRRHAAQVEPVVLDQVTMIGSSIYDANWYLQQVQDPARPESAPLIGQAADSLLVARERLHVLGQPIFSPHIGFDEVTGLGEIVHLTYLGLLQEKDPAALDRHRKVLRVVAEHLPFPDRVGDLERFREGVRRVLAVRSQDGFKPGAISAAPPEMQAVVGGAYAKVVRGGACWADAGQVRCTDTAGPVERTANVGPNVVAPGTPVELRFAWPVAPGAAAVRQWTGGMAAEPVALGPNWTFPLPREPGTYVYEAEARWEQGNGTYAFRVEVR